jgi:hypothetical protein
MLSEPRWVSVWPQLHSGSETKRPCLHPTDGVPVRYRDEVRAFECMQPLKLN